MALMYDMETVNKAMTEAAKLYDPKRPSIRVRRVLDIFAGMKPGQAVQVVRCRECKYATKLCEGLKTGNVACFFHCAEMPDDGFCHMGARIDGEVPGC